MNGTQGTQAFPQGMGQGGNLAQGAPPGGLAGGPGGPGGPGGRMLLGGPVASIGMTALFVVTLAVLAIAFWQILRKAGFTPALGLLMLVPVVNLGVALWVAFTEWPVAREAERLKLIAASAAPVPGAPVGAVSAAAVPAAPEPAAAIPTAAVPAAAIPTAAVPVAAEPPSGPPSPASA